MKQRWEKNDTESFRKEDRDVTTRTLGCTVGIRSAAGVCAFPTGGVRAALARAAAPVVADSGSAARTDGGTRSESPLGLSGGQDKPQHRSSGQNPRQRRDRLRRGRGGDQNHEQRHKGIAGGDGLRLGSGGSGSGSGGMFPGVAGEARGAAGCSQRRRERLGERRDRLGKRRDAPSGGGRGSGSGGMFPGVAGSSERAAGAAAAGKQRREGRRNRGDRRARSRTARRRRAQAKRAKPPHLETEVAGTNYGVVNSLYVFL